MMRFLLAALAVTFASPAWATDVKEVTSPGGIKAWLVEEHALPLVAVKIAFKNSGTAYDAPGKEGRAAMTSAMLSEGAGDMDSRAFNEALENNAIQLGFAVDEDLFRASVESLSEHKDKAFSYLASALIHPRLDSVDIERVRSQTLSAITQQEQQPTYIMHEKWDHLAFGTHPYANPALGSRASVAKLGKADFSAVTQHYLTRENMLIGVVGDITPDELGKMLDANLANMPVHYTPDVTLKDVTLPATAQQIVIDHDIPQTVIMFGAQGLKRSDPDYFAAYVMNHILGGSGSLTARLGQEIREKRGLAYSVYSQLDPMLNGATWRGGFSTRNEKVGEALGVMRATLKEYAANGPTAKEMADAKKYLTGSFVLGLDSNGDISNYLVSMQLNHLGRDYFDTRNAMIDKVSIADAKAAAARIADPAKMIVVMVGKPVLETAKTP
jgi:zinc protease